MVSRTARGVGATMMPSGAATKDVKDDKDDSIMTPVKDAKYGVPGSR